MQSFSGLHCHPAFGGRRSLGSKFAGLRLLSATLRSASLSLVTTATAWLLCNGAILFGSSLPSRLRRSAQFRQQVRCASPPLRYAPFRVLISSA